MVSIQHHYEAMDILVYSVVYAPGFFIYRAGFEDSNSHRKGYVRCAYV